MATKKAIRLCSGIPLVMLCALSMRGQQLPAPTDTVPGTGESSAGVTPKQPVAIASSAPKISCQNDQLTIDAVNSTLGSVLAAVHACLGVEITMPDGASEERSYVRLGPGPTREVLDALLSSTKYSYAIQSSAAVPGGISSILLLADTKDASDGPDSRGIRPPAVADGPMTAARRAWIASVRTARLAGTQPEDGGSGSVAAEPATPSSSEASPSAQTNPNAADTTAAAALSATPDVTAPPTSTLAPASSDSTQPPQSASDLQNRIEQMQQLFEQRKKMAAAQGQPPS